MTNTYTGEGCSALRRALGVFNRSGIWLVLLLLGAGGKSWAQSPVPAWQSAIAVGPGSSSYSEVRATAINAGGDVYVAGSFDGTIQVGSIALTSAGLDEIFVAKWSAASRSYVWAQRAGGTDIDYPTALAISGNSIYVAGAFNSLAADFGTFSLSNASTTRSADLFVAKLTDAGSSASFAWVQRAGGAASESVNGLAVSGTSLYVTGSFASPSLTLGATTLLNFGGSDSYVAKLTDTGASSLFAWATRGGSAGFDTAEKIAVSGSSVYIAGNFEGTMAFGSSGPVVSSAGGFDVFVVKLTDAGSSVAYNWAQRAGGSGNEYVRSLATNGFNVYVAGDFAGPTATFGAATIANASLGGGNDGFVAKLEDNLNTGNFEWAQRLGGAGYDGATALTIRGAHVYVAGHFASPSLSLGGSTLTNSGAAATYDLFLFHLLDTGSAASTVWAQQAGSSGDDYCRTLTISSTSIYVGGSVRLPAAFGTQTLTGAGSGAVGFFATLNDATNLAVATPAVLAGLSIYPSPAHGTAMVCLPASAGAGPATLTLLDAVGRVARTQRAASGTDYQVDLTGLAPGLYALRVQAGAAVATHQLVVE